jgi:hypothetical protein
LIELKTPILTNEEFAKLKYINQAGFKSVTLPILFKAADGEAAWKGAGRFVRLRQQAIKSKAPTS